MTGPEPKAVVFTDLDGTLLDRATYSYAAALPAVKLLLSRKIPIVFCSAKTRAEQEVYRSRLNIPDPFIVENGGAIFIPRGYFPFDFEHDLDLDEYLVIELGTSYRELRAALESLRDEQGREDGHEGEEGDQRQPDQTFGSEKGIHDASVSTGAGSKLFGTETADVTLGTEIIVILNRN